MTIDAPAMGDNGALFITFEGGEGAGKSTQLARLAETLRKASGREIVTTREPGGTERAEAIREALLKGAAKPYGAFAEALLFSAARIDHLDSVIRPALERGAIVLCDRFADSTRAYQGAAGGLRDGLLRALERVVVGNTRPDLTLILDLAPDIGLARTKTRASDGNAGDDADRFEAEALSFHERLRAAFLGIAQDEPRRCVVIDAGSEPEAVESAIRAAVSARFPGIGTLDTVRELDRESAS